MSSCMKLHKQPQPFPKAGVKRSPVITQAGSDRRPSPKQEQREVKDFPQVDTSQFAIIISSIENTLHLLHVCQVV